MDAAGNHLDDFPAESFSILAFCDACHHSAPMDRDRLPTGMTVKALRGRLRCLASSDMPGRFHPPMEHSHDLDQTWRIAPGSKVDNVALLREAVEPLGDVRTRFPQLRVVAQPVEAAQQGIDVPIGLLEVPLFGGVDPDLRRAQMKTMRTARPR